MNTVNLLFAKAKSNSDEDYLQFEEKVISILEKMELTQSTIESIKKWQEEQNDLRRLFLMHALSSLLSTQSDLTQNTNTDSTQDAESESPSHLTHNNIHLKIISLNMLLCSFGFDNVAKISSNNHVELIKVNH
jgi:hypothetical protein